MSVLDRFLSYVKFATKSDGSSTTCPSTEGQLRLGRFLVEEMLALGIHDAAMDKNGYVTGTIPSNVDEATRVPVMGFIAHMDVASEVPSVDIKPRVVKGYDGGEILLNEQQGIVLSPREYANLTRVVGHDLVVTDGTTLLGGDDKAGIAIILTAAERLLKDQTIQHGTVKVGFTPDEEIGRGADLFDVAGFGADFAFTVDGGAFGGMEYETFNAASGKVKLKGRSIHPGDAKGKMVNASLLAMEFHGLLPVAMRPEYTTGYEGFLHVTGVTSSVEEAELRYLLRDHDRDKLERQKELLQAASDFLNSKYGAGSCTVEITDMYYNMLDQIKPHWHIVETAYEVIRELGGTPVSNPVRGGTDGCRLSYMGLPCPNISTGGRNAHGRFEYVSVNEMEQSVELVLGIAQKYAMGERG